MCCVGVILELYAMIFDTYQVLELLNMDDIHVVQFTRSLPRALIILITSLAFHINSAAIGHTLK